MRWRRLGAYLAGLTGAVVVLAILFAVVGGRRVVEALSRADPAIVGATLAFGLCWLLAWGLMLRAVLGAFGVDVPASTSFLVYSGAVFANNVTPFGQAGGEPLAALLISKVSGERYETGLAGIASLDVLNVVPSVSLVLVGVGYYAIGATVGDRLMVAVATAVGLVSVVLVALVFVWRFRGELVSWLPGTTATVAARLWSSRIDAVDVEREVTERMTRFFEHVEQVGTDRRRLGLVLCLSLLGWLFQAAALLAAFAAVGSSVPVAVALFVIPLANVAGAAPLPGGLGGIEAAFVGLLVATTSVAAPVITAAVLIFRGAIYWLPVVLGGSSVVAFGVRTVT